MTTMVRASLLAALPAQSALSQSLLPYVPHVSKTCNAGYICIEGFATPEECKAMKQKAENIVDDFNPKQYTIFSANNTAEQVCPLPCACVSPT